MVVKHYHLFRPSSYIGALGRESLWDFTDHGPSNIVYVGTNVVDEKNHKIINACCRRPPFCSCQRADDSSVRADDCDVDWLDLFEDELLPVVCLKLNDVRASGMVSMTKKQWRLLMRTNGCVLVRVTYLARL